MNLKELRAQVKNVTDYSPELQAYDNQLDSLINQAYYRLWSRKRWNFAEKLTWLEAYPDINSARETAGVGLPISASYVDGQREITFSAPVRSVNNLRHIYEGNIIQLRDGREYTILQILSATSMIVSEPIRLLNGVASITDDVEWTIKARFYTLPEDCIEILNLQHRDVPMGSGGKGTILPPYGKTVALLPRTEEAMGLREDYTQTYAECYVPVPPTIVPPAEKLSITFNEEESPSNGSLPQNRWFEICWSFMNPTQQVGPLSDSVIVQVPENPNAPAVTYSATINFLTWDEKPVQSKNTVYTTGPGTQRPLESLRKVLWYNQNFNPLTGERLGLPKWRRITVGVTDAAPVFESNVQDNPIIVADTSSSVVIRNITSFDPGTKIYREWDGQHLRIRPYPRIDAFDQEYFFTLTAGDIPPRTRDFFRRLELRYYYKPEPLVAMTDTPQLPYEFHQVIVYNVLEDIYNKSGNLNLASLYANKNARVMKELEIRYVNRTDVFLQRGQFGVSKAGPLFDQNSLRNKSL